MSSRFGKSTSPWHCQCLCHHSKFNLFASSFECHGLVLTSIIDFKLRGQTCDERLKLWLKYWGCSYNIIFVEQRLRMLLHCWYNSIADTTADTTEQLWLKNWSYIFIVSTTTTLWLKSRAAYAIYMYNTNRLNENTNEHTRKPALSIYKHIRHGPRASRSRGPRGLKEPRKYSYKSSQISTFSTFFFPSQADFVWEYH